MGDFAYKIDIQKAKDDQTVFGWASVATRADGSTVQDFEDDIIDTVDLEKAVYDFVLHHRTGNEQHRGGTIATLVESVVFTKEKAASMGIPDGTVPEGWWVGFKITDAGVWDKVKSGLYKSFSIEGKADREEVINDG